MNFAKSPIIHFVYFLSTFINKIPEFASVSLLNTDRGIAKQLSLMGLVIFL